MKLKQYIVQCQEKLKQLKQQWKGPKRMLVIRLEESRLQALLLSRDGGIYGVEEVFSHKLNDDFSLEEALQGFLTKENFQSDEAPVALWQEGVYQEEFTLPGLPLKELKELLEEEVAMRIPLEAGSYLHQYQLLKGKEEHIIRLSAIDRLQFDQLQLLAATFNLKLELIAGGLFSKTSDNFKVEFWNCFCDQAKATQLQQEFGELIAFGIGCMRGEGIVNLLPKTNQWKNPAVLKPAVVWGGGLFLLLVGLMSLYIGWELYHVKGEIKVTELKLQALSPWKEKQQVLMSLQKDIKQREALYRQVTPKISNNSYWLEQLGVLIPAGCWLTALEEKEEHLLLRGKALEIGGVELFRKQLQTLKTCKSCELVECKQDQDGGKISFFLKVQR